MGHGDVLCVLCVVCVCAASVSSMVARWLSYILQSYAVHTTHTSTPYRVRAGVVTF